MPDRDIQIVNLSRSSRPDYESYFLDLSAPASRPAAGTLIIQALRGFHGERAIFIQNAHPDFAGKVPSRDYERDVNANVTAPLHPGEIFLRAVRASGLAREARLATMPSASVRPPTAAQTVCCADKAAFEI